MSNIVSMVKMYSWNLFPGGFSFRFSRVWRKGTHLGKTHARDLLFGAAFVILAALVFIPKPSTLDANLIVPVPDEQTTQLLVEKMMNDTIAYGSLPEIPLEPKRTMKIPLTAYTSDVAQTDATPCITASGFDVCEHNVENIVAANFLPIGTRVRIPEIYGDRVFYVEDRMNQRYYYKMDVWMKDITDARQFGVKYATVEIF